MFPKFRARKAENPLPLAKVAKVAKPEGCNHSADELEKTSLHSKEKNADYQLDRMEERYFLLLEKWWNVDEDPSITDDEVGQLLAQLDELYQWLHRHGRRVPVRLPTERCGKNSVTYVHL